MLAGAFLTDKVGSPLISRLIEMGCLLWSCIMFNRVFWVCAFLSFFCALGFSFGVEAQPLAKTPKPSPDDPARMELLRLQIFLDQAGFRPGKLDGLSGEFTQKAADRFCDARGIPRGKMPDVSHIANPYRQYTVGDDDAKWVGPTASTPEEQAKLKALLYGSLWEAVAERFHCDLNFLQELNPQIKDLSVGAVIRVPDVKEFLMSDVKLLEKQRAERQLAEKQAAAASSAPKPAAPLQPIVAPFDLSKPVQAPTPQSVAKATPVPTPAPTPTPEPQRHLVLLRAERLIEVYESDHIVACFPCTPGSTEIPVPEGQWKITGNILMPYFRWDKSILETGVRSEIAYNLPPGPNSPVGIVWMGINRPSVGMHGTNSPDRIGRNQSHGCIRLANWDAFAMCQLVKKGTTLEVR
jgi:lipoprotein-anchoring transpeptidase ErfK/SrfK